MVLQEKVEKQAKRHGMLYPLDEFTSSIYRRHPVSIRIRLSNGTIKELILRRKQALVQGNRRLLQPETVIA